ncbi:tyrosine-protein phosphatase [Nonomuraea roseoviolacea]|uniref:Protein tyrosine/serine phosphatase n=1 Tax=Nonomuraea roseoviolacea subsp. carminata TaxID=160689 RepID=A0ABT1K049_9ACTN|nr:tyrosine-protein phosphatase [Nonomuraea roseoviolacea]MCP2347004.1 protein tyrosine/serine phosphatase [Nonomuraea roseoviolacea subsp. carminata]
MSGIEVEGEPVPPDRHLDWDGCFNVRDLGGIPLPGGRSTRWRAVVRSDNPERLTPAGWSALMAHGVRTIVDLRNHDERRADPWARPSGLTTVHVPLDDADDAVLWTYLWDNELDGSPLYYRLFLERKAQRCAAAIAAVARARPGGVLVHCGLGRDRTGLIAMLLLALAGVRPDDIATDYELSAPRLPRLFAALGVDDQTEVIRGILARKNTTARAAMLDALDGLDVEDRLRAAGLTADDVRGVRGRLAGA